MAKARQVEDLSGGCAPEDLDLEALRESFNRIVRVAVELLDGVGGEVAIRRGGRVWRSSGRTVQETPIASIVEASAGVLWIEDWTQDPRVDEALVAEDCRDYRLYVGAPIRQPDGALLGVLSVLGAEPRPRDEAKAASMMDLAGLIADGAERHRAMLAKAKAEAEAIEALERAEASEQRLKLAIEIGELRMWEVDLRTKGVSSAGAPLILADRPLGFEDLTADNIWRAVHPHDRPAVLEAWRKHLEEGEPYNVVCRLMQFDGPHIWVQSASEAICDEKGELIRVVNILRNIDKAKRAELNLERTRDAAEAANRAKSEFLANMSHEIRTPLNGVMGVTSALGRTELTEAQREMVGLIASSAETLQTLLSDVLDLARIESGHLELKAEAFDLEQSVRDVAALFAPSARAKGLQLSVETSQAAAGVLVGDAPRLRQILSNLVSNAVKFTAKGGVRIRLDAQPRDNDVALSLSVADSGIGFDAEAGERLFGRFEQADGSITRRYGGTGLGLAISRSLAEAMGGRLSAVSRPGRGATFTLELTLQCSLQAPAGVAAQPADQGPRADLEGLRVLLAEDHPTNRRVVELILGAAGVSLTCVENGDEAVRAWGAGGFDLILMDMQMPVMDGLTATRLIREEERRQGLPRTPIFSLTANAMPEHIGASAQSGADGHVTKPISADELLRTVAGAGRADASATRNEAAQPRRRGA
jgi:PAS domain S-box-containing protein